MKPKYTILQIFNRNMGIVVRQSIITSILSYIGIVIGYINLLYLFPLFLSPHQLGLMRTMEDAAILLSQCSQAGISQSIIRFFPRFKDFAPNYFNIMLIGGVLAFSFFLALFFAFESSIIHYFQQKGQIVIHYFGLILWLTFIRIVTSLLESYSRCLLNNVLPNFLREIFSRIMFAVLVLFYFQGWITFQSFMLSVVLVYALSLLIMSVSLYLKGHIKFRIDLKILNSTDINEIIKFSLLSFAGATGGIIIAKMDSIMIAGMLGMVPVAIYTTSFYLSTAIEIPKRSIIQIVNPLIAMNFENNNFQEIHSLYRKVALNQFLIGLLLLIGIIINLDSVFLLMPKGDLYSSGRWVAIIICGAKLIDMICGPNGEIIAASKYYLFNILFISILALLTVTANIYLIPLYGVNGAAIGTAFAIVIFNLSKTIFVFIKLKMHPFSFVFIKILFIGIVAYGINFLIPHIYPIVGDIILRSVIVTLVFSLLSLWLKVSAEVTNLYRFGLLWLGIRKSD